MPKIISSEQVIIEQDRAMRLPTEREKWIQRKFYIVVIEADGRPSDEPTERWIMPYVFLHRSIIDMILKNHR